MTQISQYEDPKNIELFPEGKMFRLQFDPVVNKLKLSVKNYKYLEDLRESFSVPNPSSFFISRYGYRTDPKLYVINKFGYFNNGLIFEIFKWIKDNFGSLNCLAISKNCLQYISDTLTPLKNILVDDSKPVYNISDDIGRNNELKQLNKSEFKFREYQENAIRHLLYSSYGRGLIEIPTAGGKSFILANFIWNIFKQVNRKYKVLILVPNKQLVEQFYKDLLDYGYNANQLSKFTAGLKKNEKFDPSASIIIANRQYVFKNTEKLPQFDVLICDEVHQANSSATMNFINSLKCNIKVGCSGTLPRDNYLKWQLIGMFGRVVYTEDIVSLQKAGYISKLKITLLKIVDKVVDNDKDCLFNVNSNKKYKPDEFGYSEIEFDAANKAEHEYFEKHYKELYHPVFEYLFKFTSNTLILFDRIEVGKNIFEYAKDLYQDKKDVYYIDGSIDVKDREAIRDMFEQKDGNLLIAQSATMSTGINIKRLTNIVFLTSSKSFSRTIQSIGRTLRLHNSKTEAHLIDVSWKMKYSQKHLYERLKIYSDMYHKKPDEVLKFEI